MALERENYLKNQEIYWGNEQNLVNREEQIIRGKMDKLAYNLDSRVNARNDINTVLGEHKTEKLTKKRVAEAQALAAHIEQSPISYIEGWNKRH
jgi:hypothetical protein